MATKKATEDKERDDDKEPKGKDEGAVEVKLEDDDDEDEGEGGGESPVSASSTDRASREQRRRERSKERYSTIERTARDALERSERLERELNEERTRRTVEDTIRRQQGTQAGGDEHGQRMQQIRERMKGKLQALKGVQDDDAMQALAHEYQELQGELEETRIERALARRGAPVQAPVVSTEVSMLQYEFPDVFSDARKKRWASGVYEQLVADGAPEGLETAKTAARQTRTKYNGGGATPVSSAQQQRYAATPASGGPGPANHTVRIPAHLKKIARAKYPKDDEDVAYKKFARDLRRIEVA